MIRIHGQQPEPGINISKVTGKARRFPRLRKAPNYSIHILSVTASRQSHGDGYVFADDLGEIYRVILGKQFQAVVEET